MALSTHKCPNCGSPYNPTKYKCEYCGCYVFMSNDNFVDLSKINIEMKKGANDKYPGIFVFGRLLGHGERPISLGAANYYTGNVNAGGKLLLTNRSLSFSAHGLNVGRKEVTINLSDITNVKLGTNFLISQIILVDTPMETHKFAVYNGKEWVSKIMTAKKYNDDYGDGETAQGNLAYTVELRRLKGLLNDGIITQEEFDIKKRQLLGI